MSDESSGAKRRRLAVIIGIAFVVFSVGFAYWVIGERLAEDEAKEVAARADLALRVHDRDDIDTLLDAALVESWSGGERYPLRVDDRDPNIVTEIEGGLVARYRVERLSAARCVDAIWPDHGRFRVDVNRCRRYAPP